MMALEKAEDKPAVWRSHGSENEFCLLKICEGERTEGKQDE